MVIVIGFTFKNDVSVGCIPVFVYEKFNQKINGVPKIEENYQKFFLLLQVNLFVIDENRIFCKSLVFGKNKRKKRNAWITLRNDISIDDDFHCKLRKVQR